MSEYREGVLIHNYNEDRFGKDLIASGKKVFPTPKSITQSAFRDPKVVEHEFREEKTGMLLPDYDNEKPSMMGIEAHLLFGHAGDMSNTDGLRQKAFCSSSQYFYQDPKTSADENGNSVLTVEKFYESNHPQEVSRGLTSQIADKTKASWAPSKDIYESNYKAFCRNKANPTDGLETSRISRIKGEFTKGVDSVQIHRNMQY